MKLERIPWQEVGAPAESVLRQRLEDEGYDVTMWRDRCNWSYEPHTHEHDESLWVVHGRLVLRVGGEDFDLGPGDRLMLPKEMVHTANAGPDGALYLIGSRR
jgi:quercetin dioxygenase-like cupin family protein